MQKKTFVFNTSSPFYLLLLPGFFVLHGCIENFGFINAADALVLTITYIIATIILFLFFFLVFRSMGKTALFIYLLMGIYFFFGAVHEFLIKFPSFFFSRYSLLLPFLLILIIVWFFFLKKTKRHFHRVTRLLNLLFVIFILLDGAKGVWKLSELRRGEQLNANSEYQDHFVFCKDCTNPDIFFLLFDEYAGTQSLKKCYSYDNTALDSFLIKKGFAVQKNSRSNYSATIVSMASMLNMGYLENIKSEKTFTENDYASCIRLVKNNRLTKMLSRQGYKIINYSLFDLDGNPSLADQNFLPLKTKLITNRTLFSYLRKDIDWIFLIVKKLKIQWLIHAFIFRQFEDDKKFAKLVIKESSEKGTQPRFVYGHFLMPHAPFFCGPNGQPRDYISLLTDKNEKMIKSYTGYLPYVNRQIEIMVDEIQKNDPGAVILVMSDHGFRNGAWPEQQANYFENLNSVYIPEKKYDRFYDTMTNVNQFRSLLNTLFKQSFPLLKDSAVLVRPWP